MKMQDAARQHPPFEAPAGMVALLKSQGFHEINEIKVAPPVTVNWYVHRSQLIGDSEPPPFISYSASNGDKGMCESRLGTAHRTIKVYIPGQKPVTCPEHVGQEYLRVFAEWAAKSRKRRTPVEQVSASTPTHILKAQADTLIANGTWRRDVETRNK